MARVCQRSDVHSSIADVPANDACTGNSNLKRHGDGHVRKCHSQRKGHVDERRYGRSTQRSHQRGWLLRLPCAPCRVLLRQRRGAGLQKPDTARHYAEYRRRAEDPQSSIGSRHSSGNGYGAGEHADHTCGRGTACSNPRQQRHSDPGTGKPRLVGVAEGASRSHDCPERLEQRTDVQLYPGQRRPERGWQWTQRQRRPKSRRLKPAS